MNLGMFREAPSFPKAGLRDLGSIPSTLNVPPGLPLHSTMKHSGSEASPAANNRVSIETRISALFIIPSPFQQLSSHNADPEDTFFLHLHAEKALVGQQVFGQGCMLLDGRTECERGAINEPVSSFVFPFPPSR
jgi:hypothetical protein